MNKTIIFNGIFTNVTFLLDGTFSVNQTWAESYPLSQLKRAMVYDSNNPTFSDIQPDMQYVYQTWGRNFDYRNADVDKLILILNDRLLKRLTKKYYRQENRQVVYSKYIQQPISQSVTIRNPRNVSTRDFRSGEPFKMPPVTSPNMFQSAIVDVIEKKVAGMAVPHPTHGAAADRLEAAEAKQAAGLLGPSGQQQLLQQQQQGGPVPAPAPQAPAAAAPQWMSIYR